MFKETLCMFAMCMISTIFNTKPASGENRVCTPLTKLRGPHAQGICGNRIDELLSLFCVNGHNELYPSKRKKRGLSEELKKQLHNILIKREDANTYLMKRNEFHETGIVCECCYHQCSITELFSYCKPGPDLFKRHDTGVISTDDVNID